MTPGQVRAWLERDALPLWADVGVDSVNGGFVEGLTFDGGPASLDYKRMRVQARQVYVYSRAALLRWSPTALETARAGYDFLTGHYWHGDEGWVYSVTPAGAHRDTRRSAYEQAFALLAFAWFYRASEDAGALEWARRTLRFLDDKLADGSNGGYRESLPDRPPRRQNPHMHLLEAFLALYDATQDPDFLARAKSLVDLCRDRFIDRRTGTLGEYFRDDWSPAAGEAGALVEPGHHFEWVWLLHQYARLSGGEAPLEIVDLLYDFAQNRGTDPVDGFAFDVVSRSGAPRRDTKRLWPQTEALKAHLVLAESRGEARPLALADALVDGIFQHYLGAGGGIWQDRLSRNRSPLAEHVPASTFYHLFAAFSDYLRVKQPD